MTTSPYRNAPLRAPVARWRVVWSAARPFSVPFVAQVFAYAVAFVAMRHHGTVARYVVANVCAIVAHVAVRALLGLRREVRP